MIDNYKFGVFIIDKKEYKTNILLLDAEVKPAEYLHEHELKIDPFIEMVEFRPSYIIIGTGAYGVIKVPQEIIDYIEKRGIKLLIEKTGDACKEYNSLLKAGIKVAAFLHNTC